MKYMNLTFFKKAGFYISLVSAVCLIAATVCYITGFTGNLLEYNLSNVIPAAIAGIVVFVLMLLFRPTANYAPIALWVGAFATLLLYVQNIYMYFTGIFYNGVSAEAFALIDPVVFQSTILYAAAFLTANIAMYLKYTAGEDER